MPWAVTSTDLANGYAHIRVPVNPSWDDIIVRVHGYQGESLKVHAHRVPMNIQPAQAQAFIVNPLTGRKVSFASMFRTHPTTAERVDRLRASTKPTSAR